MFLLLYLTFFTQYDTEWRSIHVAANDIVSFFLRAEEYSIVCVCVCVCVCVAHIFFIYPFIDEQILIYLVTRWNFFFQERELP